MNCIFCKIAQKEIPAKIIKENEIALAFLDIMPRSPGHTLIIPKNHYTNLLEVPDEEIGLLFKLVKEVTILIKESLQVDGFTVGYNHGEVAGQEVNHFHINLIPRYEGDGGKAIQSVVSYKTNEDLDEVYKKILEAKKN